MANVNESLAALMKLEGAMCCALVDANSGMVVAKAGTGVDMDVAGAGNTEVVHSKMKVMNALGLNDVIEDILITLGKQYHIIRPIVSKPQLFVYMVLDKKKANLGMSRLKVQDIERDLTL
jgi:hypothetical protein